MYQKGFGHIVAMILGFIIIGILIGVFSAPKNVVAPQKQENNL